MNCKSCNEKIYSEDIETDFTTIDGVEKIDIQITCSGCEEIYYTFVDVKGLTPIE